MSERGCETCGFSTAAGCAVNQVRGSVRGPCSWWSPQGGKVVTPAAVHPATALVCRLRELGDALYNAAAELDAFCRGDR